MLGFYLFIVNNVILAITNFYLSRIAKKMGWGGLLRPIAVYKIIQMKTITAMMMKRLLSPSLPPAGCGLALWTLMC